MSITQDLAPLPVSRPSLLDLEKALNDELDHENVRRIKSCVDQYRFKLGILSNGLRNPPSGFAKLTLIQKVEIRQEIHDQIVTTRSKREKLEGVLKLQDRPEKFKTAMSQFIQENLLV